MQIIQETPPRSKAGQLVLTLDIGSHLDPGIRRQHRPNEDTLFVRKGILPAASPSTPATPFALLLVADGMGGQGSGHLASQLAVTSLVEYVSGFLCSPQGTPEDWRSLLSAGLQQANQVVYERN